jgi:hypothetical protein
MGQDCPAKQEAARATAPNHPELRRVCCTTMKRISGILLVFVLGLIAGGILFSRTVPRSVLDPSSCTSNCLKPADVTALLLSAGIRLAPGWIPRTVAESDQCIGIQHWRPEGRYHVAFFPKRDVRNVMELQAEDMPYLLDCLALARHDVESAGFANYRFVSNGPALQHVSYFHFHIIAK